MQEEKAVRILLAEDDRNLNGSLKYQLEQEGYDVDACFDGEDALYYARQPIYDLILLDRMLPSVDGAAVLKKLRMENINVPVIFITALGDLADRVRGLDMGADDYLVKPFAFEELLARIRCVSRRPGRLEQNRRLSFGDLVWNMGENRLEGPSGQCSLSKKEGTLLEIFLRNPGQTLSRPILLSRVWGMEFEVEEGNLDNYIHFLRRRLKTVGSHMAIMTARGVGYRLTEPEPPKT